jgi:lysine-specific demethylase 8
MTAYLGPSFQLVDTVSWEELSRRGGFGPRSTPLLIKGAVRAWPAWERWSFRSLSELRRKDGSEVVFRFQNGLVEQGVTRQPLDLPISPYLRELARLSEQPRPDDTGLLPYRRWKHLDEGERFHLDWSYMKSFKADKVYLAQWNILDEFPHLRKDFDIRRLWPGWRWTWEFVFMGPAHTVTGVHYDFPNNWFCQVRGTKEVIVFPPDQARHMCKSKKYDWGATLSDIDISRLDELPREREQFARAHGWYARVEAGDALFLPRRNWHSVVALEPSISLAVFGLTPWEIISGGGPSELRHLLHRLHLYRWGNCTCHKMKPRPAPSPRREGREQDAPALTR